MGEMIDLGTLAQWGGVALSLAALLRAESAARSKKLDERLERVLADLSRAFNRIDVTETRVERIQADIEHLPSKDFVHEMQLSQAKLEGAVSTLNERMTPMVRSLDRIEAAMIERK